MRDLLALVFATFMLAVCVLWNIQHWAKVSAHGWIVALGLNEAGPAFVAVTFLGVLVVYVVQVMLLITVFRGWRYWFQRRGSG